MDAEGKYGHQWPEGITAGVFAAGAAAIRGRRRPDRWGPVVSEREREERRGRCWAAGCGGDGPRVGRFGRPDCGSPFTIFFKPFVFLITEFNLTFEIQIQIGSNQFE